MDKMLTDEIVRKIQLLPDDLQRQVLIYVDGLQTMQLHGKPGKTLLRFAGSIESSDLALITEAIEAGCEQVDPDEW